MRHRIFFITRGALLGVSLALAVPTGPVRAEAEEAHPADPSTGATPVEVEPVDPGEVVEDALGTDADWVSDGETTSDGGLVPLVPELRGRSLAIEPGTRPYRHRLAFSPAYGTLGDNPVYSFRLAYNPSPWLGWEVSIGHNPGEAVHALFHTLDALVRYPLPWRIQPYVTAGFGQAMVFPGAIFKADPVTENALTLGGGIEFFIRSDVAIRAEMRRATVLGQDPDTDDSQTFDYREATLGLSFYRTLGR